ncbi:MAG TPA: M14 family metallopeptidase, partial [Gemmatimonadaceae bacterium]|nr:M14 family metallopeptidase [Gemmatimonadaceae bacterium]
MRRSVHRALCALVLIPVVLSACSAAAWRSAGQAILEAARDTTNRPPSLASLPRTRAERSEYRETSRYADVGQFLDSLQALGAPMRVGVMGKSPEGRDLLYVIASRPLVANADEARRLGRPVVYVQANIHAGEVEGKEALQMLLRDLVFDPRANALDSIVLVAVPVYNADGNERFAPQAVNRYEQNGPELVGERANGQRLDLNRDYVKAEAPETRASLRMFEAWDPDVFVDLHTTDGSYHGYALTYSPSLNPAAPLGAFTRDTLLPELRRRVRARRGFETFDYGNFDSVYEEKDITDSVKQGWYTYDHRPRFGTNYYGLRDRVSVLSEAFSHDPFERRVKSTYAFVAELLSLVAERGADIAARE